MISLNNKLNKGFKATSKIVIRPYLPCDRQNVFRMLPVIKRLYPKGFRWLDSRLDDVRDKKAICNLAFYNRTLVGLTIETPKGNHRVKLSTIYIHSSFRNLGIGNLLLKGCHTRWITNNINEANVTVDTQIVDSLFPLLNKFNFKFRMVEQNRYGLNRNETIFSWTAH